MCGRYTLTAKPDQLEAFLAVFDIGDFPPRYNIAPTQPILIVAAAQGPHRPGSNLPDRRAFLVRWGLIPAWAKDPKDLPLLFNARSETAAAKNAFHGAMRHRRALVPASGFYEWRREGGRTGQAYFLRPRGGGAIAFAGLWEPYLAPDGSEVDTGAILTTRANAAIASIHDRMPVVIRPEHFACWLDCRRYEPREVADLFDPVEPDFFEAIPISSRVNKVANTGPDIQEPVAEAEARAEPGRSAAQLTLF